MNKVIAIIPARGGSKGIPKKNIIDFCGKPLMAWSILQAKATPQIDEVYVSSDSDEILDISKSYGAVPIKRPDNMSGDTATSEQSIKHCLSVIDIKPDIIVMLQATSPLREKDELSKALIEFTENVDCMFSCCIATDMLMWNNTFTKSNYDFMNRGRRQDRKSDYIETGSFYMFRTEIIEKYNNRLGGRVRIYLQDLWQMFEIDTLEDLELVKFLFKGRGLDK